MKHVDLNADLAESCGNDHVLLSLVTSANICCGLHAGNAVEMRKALGWAKEYGVRVGAHPSFPDRENFGRRAMQLSTEELDAYLSYQLGALEGMCRVQGVELAYVKPHGALYNQAGKDGDLALQVARCIYRFNPKLKLMGLAGSRSLLAAQEVGLTIISEVFADRHYMPDGSLVPRSQPNALVDSEEEALAQILQMVEQGTVTTVDGSCVPVQADSICLHGDGEHALAFAKKIRAMLEEKGFIVGAKK